MPPQPTGEGGSSLAGVLFSGDIGMADAPGQGGGDPCWEEELGASDLPFGLADDEMEMEGTGNPPLVPGSVARCTRATCG
jgi:hypothetical protein